MASDAGRGQGTVRILRADCPYFLAAKAHVQDLIEQKFQKPELLLEAMYPIKNEWARIESGRVLKEASDRMAMIGDAVLKMASLIPVLNFLS